MTTVLQYLVIAAVIGLLLFGTALLLFGRGERLSALPARTSPAQLPERGIEGADVRRVRFALAVRGYRMSDVDWTLDRLADELDRTRQQLAQVSGSAFDGSDGEPAELLPVELLPTAGESDLPPSDTERQLRPGFAPAGDDDRPASADAAPHDIAVFRERPVFSDRVAQQAVGTDGESAPYETGADRSVTADAPCRVHHTDAPESPPAPAAAEYESRPSTDRPRPDRPVTPPGSEA